MGADSFKSQGISLQLSGAQRGAPTLGPQGGGLPLVQRVDPSATPPQGQPVFSVSPAAAAPMNTQPTAPLGGSKIPSLKTSKAGGGARDAFTPAGGASQIRLLGAAPVALAGSQADPMAQLAARQAPEASGGPKKIVLCEAIAETPDGVQWTAPYEAEFPAGAKFLGVRTSDR